MSDMMKIKKIKDVTDLKQRTMTVLFFGTVSIAGYKLVLKPYLDKIKKEREGKLVANDPDKQQATILSSAMNPSGISWLRWADTTDVEAIFLSAEKITDLNKVQTAYKNLYQRDLLQDLQGELSTEQYKTFLSIINSRPSDKKATVKGYLIVANKDVRLRSTPDSDISALSFNSNILDTVFKGTFLGYSTGKQKVDKKGVIFIEVKIQFRDKIPSELFKTAKTLNSKTLTFWVGKGAIDLYRYYKQMFENNPGIKVNFKNISDMGLRTQIDS